MGLDVGTPYPRKNSEVGTDSESNAYHIWTGADQGVYMSRSTDSGNSWEENSIRISPAGVIHRYSLISMLATPEESPSLILEAKM